MPTGRPAADAGHVDNGLKLGADVVDYLLIIVEGGL
jgi:hypothetical protein